MRLGRPLVLVMLASGAASADPDPAPDPATPPPAVVTAPTIAPAPEATTPAPVPAPKKISDDVDLGSLDLDPTRPDEHLNIYGFMDVSWQALLVPSSDLSANYFPKENSFLVGNVNLYATKNLSRKWRSLLELRFLYAPSGNVNADGTFVHTTAPDPADVSRPTDYGSVSIERAYLEYEINESLTVQAGSFLTPYGIWNVDHGSPTIIPVTRPYIIGEDLFPQEQTGVHVYGRHAIRDYLVGYHATISNGRGPMAAFRDLDSNKAVGARLELETRWLDGVRFGISGYQGRFTDRPADTIGSDSSGKLINVTPPGISYDELAWGANASLKHGGLLLQAELIGNDRSYRVGNRERSVDGGFLADGQYLGTYLLAGYRFDRWWQVMPFAVFEFDRLRASVGLGDHPRIYQTTVGLNFRPDPSVALKLSFSDGEVFSPLLNLSTRAVMTQAAWAF